MKPLTPEARARQLANLKSWPKGVSGNPNGKKTGSRHRVTLALEAMLDGEGRTLTRKVVKLAKAGDMAAMKIVMDRILPARRDRPVAFPLGAISSAAQAAEASAQILAAVSSGQLTPYEGVEISKLVDCYVRAAETHALEARVARLEGKSVLLEP